MMGERGKNTKGRIDRIVKAVRDAKVQAEKEAEQLREFDHLKENITRNLATPNNFVTKKYVDGGLIDFGRENQADWYHRNHQHTFQESFTSAGSGVTVAQSTTGHTHTLSPEYVPAVWSGYSSPDYEIGAAMAFEKRLEEEQERQALLACAWCGKVLGSVEERDEHEEDCGT